MTWPEIIWVSFVKVVCILADVGKSKKTAEISGDILSSDIANAVRLSNRVKSCSQVEISLHIFVDWILKLV